MARHGENIRKRKDGRWEGRYGVYSAEKGKKVYRSVYGKSYAEARRKLTREKMRIEIRQENLPETRALEYMEEAAGSGMMRNHGSLPVHLRFSDLAQNWLAEVKNTRKASTYVKYKLVYEKYLQNIFGDTDLSRITDAFVREQIPEGLTDSVRKSIYCVLNQILRFASRQYGVTLPLLRRPPDKGSKKTVQSFSRKDQRKLFPVLLCGQDHFKTAVLLCLYTGLRLGEVCALRWEDVDFAGGLITVNRTVQRLYAEGHRTKTVLWETGPKSEHSRREIPISDGVMGLLFGLLDSGGRQEGCLTRAFAGRHRQEGHGKEPERGQQKEHQDKYVFGGKKPVEPRTMQNHFKKILKEAGLEERNFHILRHTFATNCIEGGTDVKSLSELLGHSDVQITLNRYVHPTLDSKRKHLDVLSLFYGQIHGQVG